MNEITDAIPTLTTERLTLRPFNFADANIFSSIMQRNPDIHQYIPCIPRPYPVDMAEAWIASHPKMASRGSYIFAVTKRGQAEVMGNISIDRMGLAVDLRSEMGYWMDGSFRGQGYMAEAVRRMIVFGFEALDLNKITASAVTSNAASLKVMVNAGMVHEATLKRHAFVLGEFADVALYSVERNIR